MSTQPIFSRNADYTKTAFFNWRISSSEMSLNFLNIAEGYMKSAITLAEYCLENNQNKIADIFIFPILNDSNHGIEIYLKGMIHSLDILLGRNGNIVHGHDIKILFETFKQKVKEAKGLEPERDIDQEMSDLSEYLDELCLTINDDSQNSRLRMDFSRYPMGIDSRWHFYVTAAGNVEVDLENFRNRFQKIAQDLKSYSSYLIHLCNVKDLV